MSIPHLIAFVDPDCQGDHTHIFNSITELPKDFNDTISSFVVLGGIWKIFDEPDFEKQIGDVYSEGVYSVRSSDTPLTEEQIETLKQNFEDGELPDFNDKISSIQLVALGDDE